MRFHVETAGRSAGPGEHRPRNARLTIINGQRYLNRDVVPDDARHVAPQGFTDVASVVAILVDMYRNAYVVVIVQRFRQ